MANILSMSIAYLISEQVKFRHQPLKELTTRRHLLTEHDSTDKKQLAGGIRICISRTNLFFLAYETELVLENPILQMGWDSSHAMFKVTSELYISEVSHFCTTTKNSKWHSEKSRYAT